MKQSRMIKAIKNNILIRSRLYVITAMVILIAVTAGVQNGLKEMKILQLLGGSDDITRFEKKIERLRRVLPPFGVIGYYSDKKFDAKTFCLTRYTLSPRIIVQGFEHPFIIGNFSRSANPDEFAKAHDLSIVQTVDNSMVLFKKRR